MVWIRRLSYAVLCSLLFLACGGEEGSPGGPKEKQEEEEPEARQGWLAILLHGLPDDIPAGILVKGPGGFEKVVDASDVLAELEAGVYRVEAEERLGPAKRYAPSRSTAELEVKEGETTLLEIGFESTDRSLFTLAAAKDLALPLFGKVDLLVEIERPDGYKGAIELRTRGLPPGLSSEDVMVPPGEVLGRIPITSDGSLRNLKTVAFEVVGEALGQKRTTEALIRPEFTVSSKKDGAPGSLRSLLKIANQIEGVEVPTITFDPRTFAKQAVLEMEAPLEIGHDVIVQGVPGGEAPQITLDGGEVHTILVVGADAEVEIRDLGFRRGEGSTGGAILNYGTLTLKGVHITDSHAAGGGGIGSVGDLVGEDLTVEGCSSHYEGGGILAPQGSVVLTRARLLDNESRASNGGGLSFQGSDLLVTDSEFIGNKATLGGGGLHVSGSSRVVSSRFEGNRAAAIGGGAIYSEEGLVLISSTIHDNLAFNSYGGGIYLAGHSVVMNSTIARNNSRWVGGGIFLQEGAFALLSHCTIAQNTGEEAGIVAHLSSLSIRSSIAWGNQANSEEDEVPEDIPDIHLSSSTFTSYGYNIIGEISNAGPNLDLTDRLGADPLLLPLGENGGPTKTMALQPESFAVDFIPLDECIEGEDGILLVDQRGLPRPAGEGCDVGAYEVQQPSNAVIH